MREETLYLCRRVAGLATDVGLAVAFGWVAIGLAMILSRRPDGPTGSPLP